MTMTCDNRANMTIKSFSFFFIVSHHDYPETALTLFFIIVSRLYCSCKFWTASGDPFSQVLSSTEYRFDLVSPLTTSSHVNFFCLLNCHHKKEAAAQNSALVEFLGLFSCFLGSPYLFVIKWVSFDEQYGEQYVCILIAVCYFWDWISYFSLSPHSGLAAM